MRGISAGDMRQWALAAHLVSLERLVVENFSAIERIAFEWCAATEQWIAVIHYRDSPKVDRVWDIVPAQVRVVVQEAKDAAYLTQYENDYIKEMAA